MDVLHNKIDIFFVMECLHKANYVGKYSLLEYLLLLDHSFLHLLFLNVLLR